MYLYQVINAIYCYLGQIEPLQPCQCGQEIIIIPKLLTERVGMVLKTAEYYLMNLAKNGQVKVGKTTCRSCNSRTWLFHVHCRTLPDFWFLLRVTICSSQHPKILSEISSLKRRAITLIPFTFFPMYVVEQCEVLPQHIADWVDGRIVVSSYYVWHVYLWCTWLLSGVQIPYSSGPFFPSL